MSEKAKRSNLWISILYPEDSLPDNFISIIQSWHIPVLLSPVHDADLNADESEKKAHIHMMIDFGSGQNKSFDQVFQLTSKLKGTAPIICHSRNAMIRYFCHKDNPEKHQYQIDDLMSISGFEYAAAFENYTNEVELYKFVENLIYDNVIYNYSVLCKYMDSCNLQYELQFVRKHTIHFRAILDGQWQLIKSGRQIYTDKTANIEEFVKLKDIDSKD